MTHHLVFTEIELEITMFLLEFRQFYMGICQNWVPQSWNG